DGSAAQYHILAGEMAMQRGLADTAARHYVAALQYTSSVKLARRATRIALFAGNRTLAYQGAEAWARQAPASLVAQRTATRLALSQGDAQALLRYSRSVVAAVETNDKGYQLLGKLLSGKPEHGELAVHTLQQLA